MSDPMRVDRSSSKASRILLTEDEAAEEFGVSPRKFCELRSEEWMPEPIQLGPRLLRWIRSELEAAVAHAPRAAATEEPESLAAARRRRIEAMKTGSQR